MSTWRRLAPLLVALVFLGSAVLLRAAEPAPTPKGISGVAPAGPPPSTAAARKALVDETAHSLRCPVCQGLSVADSPSPSARSMLARIGELVDGGYSPDQIRSYFVDRYGEWVLLEPPPRGMNLIVWLAPLAALALGAWFVAMYLRQGTEASGAVRSGASARPDDEDPYVRRVLEELEQAESER